MACAIAARNPQLRQATLEDALTHVAPEVVEDAKAAAALMGMNNVYYRFRHMVGREEYAQKPARLRMQRLVQVATNKVDFELFCLAVSAINGCESCIRSHERVVVEGGLDRGPRQRRGAHRRDLPRRGGGARDVARSQRASFDPGRDVPRAGVSF